MLNVESIRSVAVICNVELTGDDVMNSVVPRCNVVVFCSFVLSVGANNVVLSDKVVLCTIVVSETVTVMFCELVWRTGCAVEDCVLLIVVNGVVVSG